MRGCGRLGGSLALPGLVSAAAADYLGECHGLFGDLLMAVCGERGSAPLRVAANGE